MGIQMELGRRGNMRTEDKYALVKNQQSNNPIGQKSNGQLFFLKLRYVCVHWKLKKWKEKRNKQKNRQPNQK